VIVPFITIITREDYLVSSSVLGRLYALSGASSPDRFALICIFVLIGIYLLKAVYLYFEYSLQARFISGCKKETQGRLIRSLLSRPYAFFLDKNSAEIQKVLVTDLNKVFQVQQLLLLMFTELIISILVMIALFFIDPVMSLCVLLIVAATVVWIGLRLRPKLHDAGDVVIRSEKKRSRWISQGLAGIKEVKHLHAEDYIAEQVCSTEGDICRGEQVQRKLNNVPRVLIEAVCVCGMLLVLAVMMLSGRTLSSLLPAVSAFAMAAVKLLPGANRVTTAAAAAVYNLPALEHVTDILKEEGHGAVEAAVHGYTVLPGEESDGDDVVFSHVTYGYPGNGINVLDDVSLRIRHGEMIGIIGASGAGKTTFADLMMGLLLPHSGEVAVYGSIGYIPQDLFMLDDTVRANVAFGVPAEDVSDEKVWHCLEEAQLADHLRGIGSGLETEVGERGIRLSGGQVQRLGIARALYRNPDILVFDEATSSLDPETEAAVIEAVNGMHGSRTIVIISHKSGILSDCDRIFRVTDGKLILDEQKELEK
ncbi:MAG: ABC transporter ATP-binding protein, partial [Clostridia bacterium]|nr:ABC transporter ATP-binding protein [Clostridia bacterium]